MSSAICHSYLDKRAFEIGTTQKLNVYNYTDVFTARIEWFSRVIPGSDIINPDHTCSD